MIIANAIPETEPLVYGCIHVCATHHCDVCRAIDFVSQLHLISTTGILGRYLGISCLQRITDVYMVSNRK